MKLNEIITEGIRARTRQPMRGRFVLIDQVIGEIPFVIAIGNSVEGLMAKTDIPEDEWNTGQSRGTQTWWGQDDNEDATYYIMAAPGTITEGLARKSREARKERQAKAMSKIKFAPFLAQDFLGMMEDIYGDTIHHYDPQYGHFSFDDFMGNMSEAFLQRWIDSYVSSYVHEEIWEQVRKKYPTPPGGGITYQDG